MVKRTSRARTQRPRADPRLEIAQRRYTQCRESGKDHHCCVACARRAIGIHNDEDDVFPHGLSHGYM